MFAYPFGGKDRIGGLSQILEQYGELIAAEPCRRISDPDTQKKPLGDHLQEPIACFVAQTVIDDFEPVEIEKNNACAFFAARRPSEALMQPVHEEARFGRSVRGS